MAANGLLQINLSLLVAKINPDKTSFLLILLYQLSLASGLIPGQGIQEFDDPEYISS